MRMNRFIVDCDLPAESVSFTEKKLINQIKNVLRMRKGETIILSDGKGKEAIAEISQISKSEVEVTILKEVENLNDPLIHAVLYCSILKRENFEWVLQKACEVGIREIVPIISERTVKTGINERRLQKIMREAAEQSERSILPKLHGILYYSDAVHSVSNERLNFLFERSGTPVSDHTLHENVMRSANEMSTVKANCFIGPEGGWTSGELRMARENSFTLISLSTLNFRSETAAAIASYLICQQLLR